MILDKDKRIPLPPLIRSQVYIRDNFTCQGCGAIFKNDASFDIHHIIPVSRGGKNELDNLILLCKDCHMRLHGKTTRRDTISNEKAIRYKIDILTELSAKGYSRHQLRKRKIFSEQVMSDFKLPKAKMNANTLGKVCEILGLQPGDILYYGEYKK